MLALIQSASEICDRNLSDYDHTAVESDLVLTQDESESIVTDFIADLRAYLVSRGVAL